MPWFIGRLASFIGCLTASQARARGEVIVVVSGASHNIFFRGNIGIPRRLLGFVGFTISFCICSLFFDFFLLF